MIPVEYEVACHKLIIRPLPGDRKAILDVSDFPDIFPCTSFTFLVIL